MDASFVRAGSVYWWLAVLWTAGILGAFSLPATSLPQVQPALSIDKLVHFGLFLGFGILWMRALCPPRPVPPRTQVRWYSLGLFGMGALFAGGSELYQYALPIRRLADPYDALANGIGLLTGVAVYVAFIRWRRRHAERPVSSETGETPGPRRN